MGYFKTLQNTHVRIGIGMDLHAMLRLAFNGNIGSATGKGEGGGGKEKGQEGGGEEEVLVE